MRQSWETMTSVSAGQTFEDSIQEESENPKHSKSLRNNIASWYLKV